MLAVLWLSKEVIVDRVSLGGVKSREVDFAQNDLVAISRSKKVQSCGCVCSSIACGISMHTIVLTSKKATCSKQLVLGEFLIGKLVT